MSGIRQSGSPAVRAACELSAASASSLLNSPAVQGPSAAILADQLLDDNQPTERQAAKAKAEAVRVMERYESESKGVHDELPHFTDAPEVTSGSDRSSDQGSGPGSVPGSGGTVASSAPSGGAGGALGGLGAGHLVGGGAQGQPGVVDDGGQDVVELVGHAAGQRPHAAELLRLE